MRKVIFAEGGVYHIFNRGVDKRQVFLDEADRYRFVQGLCYMNTSAQVLHPGYMPDKHFGAAAMQRGEVLVDVLQFVIMPNHFHLLLMQRFPAGVALYMQKLGTAYTMYFNKKYQRNGALFQGRYKGVLVKREEHFEHIPFYVHANPLKLSPDLASVEEEIKFLKKFKWSSFRDYAGGGDFPTVTNRALMQEFYDREGGIIESTRKWLQNRRERLSRLNLQEVQPRQGR